MRTFADLLSSRTSQSPDSTAYRFLVTGDVDGEVQELSYAELGRRSRAVGGWLQEQGFAGGRALLLFPPGLEFVTAFMGCVVSGVVAVPCSPPYGRQAERALRRIGTLVADAGASVVLTTEPFRNALQAAAERIPELAALTWVAVETIPDQAEDRWRESGADADSIAFLQYTSGSTSAPRGVMVSHGNLLDNLAVIADALGHTPEQLADHDGDVLVSWLPAFHDMGLIGGVLQSFYVGGTSTLFSPLHFLQKPERWLTAVSAYRAHTSGAPNFAYELCLRAASPELLDRLDLSPWKVAFNAAEPVRASTLRRFAEVYRPAGFRFESSYPCYGLAETTLMVTGGAIGHAPTILIEPQSGEARGAGGDGGVEGVEGDGEGAGADQGAAGEGAGQLRREVVTAGYVRPGLTVVIANPETGTPCADGEEGEIRVAGASVAQGYWGRAEDTERLFHSPLSDGRTDFLKTGDLGFLRDGELFVTGRIKDLLIIDGKNHYPQDLELAAEQSHPAVRPGCLIAFSVPGPQGEQPVLVAEVEARTQAELDAVEAAVRGAVAEQNGLSLGAVALIRPRSILKTTSGKLQRRACRAAFLADKLDRVVPVAEVAEAGEVGDVAKVGGVRDAADVVGAAATAAGATGVGAAGAAGAVSAVGVGEARRQGSERGKLALDAAGLQEWLVAAVARHCGLDPAAIDAERPIADYGLGSRVLVELVAELSTLLGRPLEPTVLYDYPTISSVAAVLGVEQSRPAERPSAPADEPVAIVSMACRFPGGADDPQALWRLLVEGRDAVGDPPGRWNVEALHDPDPEAVGKAYTLQGGYLRDIDRFDAEFFGISPREAAGMDPQQRLLLQTCWETLERAGLVPRRLNESATGVYIGMYGSDYMSGAGLDQLDGHIGTGSAGSVASGRLAYLLGLHGPAVTVDTACSSSLVAMHLAVQALRSGECDLALAGGATLMVTPRPFVEFSRLRGLSASGRCKPFSASADGMVWAEGCGLLLLKRLSDAERDGDRVLAVIRGSAVNQDGRSQGLTAPNGLAQERVVRAALSAARLSPHDVDYVEAHGTGTPLGDPIEAFALARVFGPQRAADLPLYLGSLKSNLGHTQAAAGVAGVIKTVLALEHEQLPASLHAETPAPQVDWAASGIRVLNQSRTWARGARVRRAGVSSFGISGTNAHLIIEEAPARAKVANVAPGAGPGAASGGLQALPLLFPVSARSESALRGQAERLAEAVDRAPAVALPAVARTLARHRTHFERRAVVVASGREELVRGLRSLANGQPDGDLVAIPRDALTAGKLAFVLPGQGSQWAGMAADLLDRSAVFAEEFARCDAALRPLTGWSATAVLRGEPGAADLARVDVVQPVLFAVMVSLGAAWRALGVRADAVIGHSQGEVAAAYLAGALTLADAAKVVVLRSRAISEIEGTGGMAVVELPLDRIEPRVAALGGRVSVAAVNSGRSTVLAGDGDALDTLIAELEGEQVFARRVRVDYASHSPQVEPAREAILTGLADVAASAPTLTWYSTLYGAPLGADDRCDAGYWYRNLREPVRFADTVRRMIDDGYRYFVELSPHPSLLIDLETIAEDAGRVAVAVGSLRRDEDGTACLARSLGALHVAGRDLDWDRLAPAGAPIELPTYAFDRERHWTEPRPDEVSGRAVGDEHPWLGVRLESVSADRLTFRKSWSKQTADWLGDHTVFGRRVLSGTTILDLCRSALESARPDAPTDVADLVLLTPLMLPGSGTVEVQIEIDLAVTGSADSLPEICAYSRPGGGGSVEWTLHATASGAAALPLQDDAPPSWPQDAESLWTEEAYARLAEAGLEYGPAFQGVREVVAVGEGAALARIALPEQAREGAAFDGVHPALLDAALQAIFALGDASGRALLPAAVGRWTVPPGAPTELTALVTRTAESDTELTANVTLWDVDGLPAGRLLGVRLRAADGAELVRGSGAGRDLYAVRWTQLPAPEQPDARIEGAWVVLHEEADQAVDGLTGALKGAGAEVADLDPGEPLSPGTDGVLRIWPSVEPGPDLPERVLELTTAALAELTALLAVEPGQRPSRVVWVTRGAVATDAAADQPVPGLAQSALWGLARSARAEHPDLGLSLIDADPAAPDSLPAGLLEALRGTDEPELAIRGGVLLAPRLSRVSGGNRPTEGAPPLVPADGTVLITGGLGAVGAQTALRLAERGVRHFLLVSRQGAQDPRADDVVAQLATLGARAEVAACDIADADALGAVLDGIDPRTPLRGIVHCAGLLDDGVLTSLTTERLARVQSPKVAGAWNLHRLTADTPLDLFVLVSSAAGVLGSPGQANYAAANVFLDQLAYRRRALGLPGISVSYGVWSGEGLAAAAGGRPDRISDLGVGSMAPERALDLLELSLLRNAPHLLAATLDLERIRGGLAVDGAASALWRGLLPRSARPGAGGGTLVERLARLSDAERSERVLALVTDETARALGLSSAGAVRPDRPLREVGLDSVTALELRNRISARIGVRLPATLLYDRPTTAELAEYLLATALRRPDGSSAATSSATAAASRNGAAQPRAADEPIAIVSMACRLPGGIAEPDQLWRLLAEGGDGIGPFPADRWDVEAIYDPDPERPGRSVAHEGGFISGIDAFDARFFGITEREARSMDPQQRLLLETAWEALERGGIVPGSLAGSRTGVYIGMFGSEYASGAGLEQLDGYLGTGSAGSVASGRLAYTLGLVGPAVTVDTACSSSLLAVHLAATALRGGECDAALVGGATLMPTPLIFVEFSRLRGLSPGGRCRSFSDEADGTGFSEGVGVVVLKRLSDARRDGDEVLAVLRGTAVNQDGRSQGLSVPHGPSQEEVIRLALERSHLVPADIDYVEAHGTGTSLGDPIEANALAQVFGDSRPTDRPLLLGSLKSNLGHLQAAAGIAGLMKTVLALRHEELPRTLHASTPTHHVDWEDSGLRLLQEPAAWQAGERTRRAGVSAFGISGTNVHVVVEEAPEPPAPATAATAEPAPRAVGTAGMLGERLFVLSARSDAALRRQAGRLARHLDAAPETTLPDATLLDTAFTLARHRTRFEHRATVLAADRAELVAALDGLAESGVLAPPDEPITGKTVFVFSGHAPRWIGMAADLLATSEAFADALARCDEAIGRHVDWSVLAVLRGDDGTPDIDRADVAQPVLFAIGCALAELWRSLGVEPDAVVGHSLGEVTAAHVAGVLTLDEAAAVVTARGLAVRAVAGRGATLAIRLPRKEIEPRLAAFGGRLTIAAVNDAQSAVVSGDLAALDELRAQLEAEQIRVHQVPVDFATHSAHIDEVREDLLDRVAGIAGGPARIPMYSTVLSEPVNGETVDAAYWFRNLREPVRFADVVGRLVEDGFRHFVEIGPQRILVPSVKIVAEQAGIAVSTVASLRRDEEDDTEFLLRNWAQLFGAGHEPDLARVFPTRNRIELPTYAFEADRHWLPSAPSRTAGASDGRPLVHLHLEQSDEPGRHVVEAEIDLADDRFGYLADHRVAGEVWLPAAAFLEFALETAELLRPGGGLGLGEIRFERPLSLTSGEPVRLQLVARPTGTAGDAWAFTISSRSAKTAGTPWTRHVAGVFEPADAGSAQQYTQQSTEAVEVWRERCAEPVEIAGHYAGLAETGLEYGEAFRGLTAAWSGPREALGELAHAPETGRFAAGGSAYLLHPAVLDAALQTVALPGDARTGQAFVPAAVGRVRRGTTLDRPVWATTRLRSLDSDSAVLDVRLLDERERPVVEIEGVRLAALSRLDGALFEVQWRSRPLAQQPPTAGTWLIFADESGVGSRIAELLGDTPHVLALPGNEFRAEGNGRYRVNPADPAHLARLFDEAFSAGPPVRIVQLTALDAPPVDSAETLARAAEMCCTPTLHLVAALADKSWRPASRLFLVTRAGQAAAERDRVTHPQQALAWGFGSAVAQEHPELRVTLIDLPAEGGVDELVTQLRYADDEPQVALRGAERLVPRLVRGRAEAEPARLRADRTYLVTGGLGGLGRVAAERLAKLGAGHVALVGRSEPDASAAQWIDTLRERGAKVHTVRADVADRAGLEAALDDLQREAPPIGGVVHTAGVLDDATLLNLTPERIIRVLAPKVLGTALLTELTPEADFLVLYSSAAGLLGSAGQSSYSAANAFLDAWAHHLRSDGRSALSLDWGAWSEVGMVAAADERGAAIRRLGLGAFSPQDGGELFERLLGSARAQLAPILIDRATLAARPELAVARPLLAELVGGAAPQPTAPGSRDLLALIRETARTPEAPGLSGLLEDYVRGIVTKVSGEQFPESSLTTPLKELGLDSLMLVTLQTTVARELGVEPVLPAGGEADNLRGYAEAVRVALAESGGAAESAAEPAAVREVPEVELRPATRDAIRLLRTELQGTPSATHNIGFAVRLENPTTRERLTGIIASLAARHAALRTAIVPDTERGQRFEVRLNPAGQLLRWSEVGEGTDVDQRLRELMEPPFDLTVAPLWRFELLAYPSGEQVLVYGAHHAVSDAQSLVVVMAELGAELSGAQLDPVASNRDVDLLLKAQNPDAQNTDRRAEPISASALDQFSGSRRLELTLARPRPAERSYRAETRFVHMPDGLLEQVTAQANRLGITPAAFCLGTLTVYLARLRAQNRFVLAVPVDTRMHADAQGALGFFGVPIPFAAEVRPDEPIADVLRRADARLDHVLEKGASFTDVMPTLVAEGLNQSNAPLVEVYFNYIRPQALKARGLEVVQAGTGYADVDLMVMVAYDLGYLRMDYSVDILDEDSSVRFGQEYLELLAELATGPDAPAASTAVPPALPAPPITATAPTKTVALAATFALGHLSALLESAVDPQDALAVAEAPYHQALASLRDPAGVFADQHAAAGVVLLRAADLSRFGEVSDELLAELAEQYPAALRSVGERSRFPLIVGFLPTPVAVSAADERLARWEHELAEKLREEPGIAVLGPQDWGRDHPVADPFDPETEQLAHLPYLPEFQAVVALTLAEVLRAVRRPVPKVIAVDADETLWGGIAGELGPDGVDLTGPRAALARRLLAWRAAGVLLVLISKNDESTLLGVLERPDSLLKAEHFSAISAGWEPKPARLEAVARALNLGLDSFLFLDDNPVEIAAVRAALPEVLCVTCPAADELEAFLARLWPLVPRPATGEDAARADFYRQEQVRQAELERTGFAEFLESLHLEIDLRPLSPATLERSVQLSRRTNQFNLRPAALDDATLSRWEEDGEVWTAVVRDRFGDYGQVGVLAIRPDGGTLEVLAWMLSCRALGRGVEERLLQWLAERAEVLDCTEVRLIAEHTQRNAPARRLVAGVGGAADEDARLDLVVGLERLRSFRSWDRESNQGTETIGG